MKRTFTIEEIMPNAILLLNDTELNISQIAYQLDFNDPRYFSRCFRAHFGTTPSKYRKNLLLQKQHVNANRFVEKAIERVEKCIANPDYIPQKLAQDMNMSVSTLWRKVKINTGQTPTEFIRKVRLKKAKQLLGNSNDPLWEVAMASGYNDVKYFSRCFRAEFGQSPSRYMQNRG
ncbi:MAG: helix-turn-helix domain-containing protein [Paludibacter sp.]